MNTQFKKGDKVKCIDAKGDGSGLTLNKIYTILDSDWLIKIINDFGDLVWWRNSRFELVTEDNSKFKHGDKVKAICSNGEVKKGNTYIVNCAGKVLLLQNICGYYPPEFFELITEDNSVKLNTLEEQLELIKAESEGKQIQYKSVAFSKVWFTKTKGQWRFNDTFYRIKPVKPKKVKKTITKYAIINSIGNILSIHNTEAEALKRSCPTAKVVTLKGSYYTTEEQ